MTDDERREAEEKEAWEARVQQLQNWQQERETPQEVKNIRADLVLLGNHVLAAAIVIGVALFGDFGLWERLGAGALGAAWILYNGIQFRNARRELHDLRKDGD